MRRGEEKEGAGALRPRGCMGCRPEDIREACVPGRDHSPSVRGQAGRMGEEALPQAGLPDMARAQRSSVHQHRGDQGQAEHHHQPQFRRNDNRPGLPEGIGRVVRRQLLQYPQRTGVARQDRHGLCLQQPLPRGSAAVFQCLDHGTGRTDGRYDRENGFGAEDCPKAVQARNPLQEIRSDFGEDFLGPIQQEIFDPIPNRNERLTLSESLDLLNHKYGIKTVRLAVEGSKDDAWKVKSEHRTPNHLTELKEILTIQL